MERAPERRSVWPLAHIGAGTLIAGVVYLLEADWEKKATADLLKGRRQDIYSAGLTLQTTLLGFGLATLTIVLGYATSEKFVVLREAGWLKQLFGVFTSALRSFALGTAVMLTNLLVDRDGSPEPVLTAIAAGVTSVAICRLVQLLWTLERVVALVITNQQRAPGA